MFFILSKIFVYFLYPFTWLLGLFVASFFVKKIKTKKWLFRIMLIIFLIFSNSLIFDSVISLWEVPAKSLDDIQPQYDYGVVLGGMITVDFKNKKIVPQVSIDRLMQTIVLYKKGYIKKIFISGGSGSLIDSTSESIYLREYLMEIGIPSEDIFYESYSRNTHENALETFKVLCPDSVQPKIMLITSAFHMRRAVACFKKAGFQDMDTFPTTNFHGTFRHDFYYLFVPEVEILAKWNFLIKEWVGYMVYGIVGYL